MGKGGGQPGMRMRTRGNGIQAAAWQWQTPHFRRQRAGPCSTSTSAVGERHPLRVLLTARVVLIKSLSQVCETNLSVCMSLKKRSNLNKI